ncbi:rRNA pseudouridine synthase [Methylacidiphilum caldifontis]|uniref:pseudouridine synthase n=1 Tax=Methylacidiphilum caldifontis TaxID=2795386 RepID=UPI001A8F9CDE|nr:pseudouridine synthase [Methylacidiphilum caldifontis]QSR87999.1 rRNA pseudouridine synthase [Methylacidiphilum caldifontis]
MKAHLGIVFPIRINRYLASCGLGSRRSCETLVREGRIKVNGLIVRTLGQRIYPEDKVELDGNQLLCPQQKQTFLFYKPRGIVCSRKNAFGEKTIYDLLPPSVQSLFYVGRLDKESEGLLLLTNDGLLANKILHPKYHFTKSYIVSLGRAFDEKDKKDLLKGMYIEGKRVKAEEVIIQEENKLKVVLTQGMKRQIRIMLSILGYKVIRLRRIAIGPLTLGKMKPGELRPLTEKEKKSLYRACELL